MTPTDPSSTSQGHRVALLVTGASGMRLPQAVLAALAGRGDVTAIHLVVSAGASQVLRHELGRKRTGAADLIQAAGIQEADRARIQVHRDSELGAPIASGSYRLTGAAVVPASSATLGALATGTARTLIHRAGAVALKERWPLVLGFRETPLSLVHLENLRRLALAGAVILPPIPAFYIGDPDRAEQSLERFAAHYAMRVLDALGLPPDSHSELRWAGEN